MNQPVIVYMEWWCARDPGIRSAGARECGIDRPGVPPATLVAIVAAAALSAARAASAVAYAILAHGVARNDSRLKPSPGRFDYGYLPWPADARHNRAIGTFPPSRTTAT